MSIARSTEFRRWLLTRRYICVPLNLMMYLTDSFKIQVTAIAENWAKTLAAQNSFFHSGIKGYGENLYASWGTQVTGKNPVDAFYAEIKDYNFNAPGFSIKTGQLQQYLFRILIHDLFICFIWCFRPLYPSCLEIFKGNGRRCGARKQRLHLRRCFILPAG